MELISRNVDVLQAAANVQLAFVSSKSTKKTPQSYCHTVNTTHVQHRYTLLNGVKNKDAGASVKLYGYAINVGPPGPVQALKVSTI